MGDAIYANGVLHSIAPAGIPRGIPSSRQEERRGPPFPRNRPAKSVRKCVRGKAISILQAARIPWKRFIGLSCEGAIASNGRCRSDSCALPAIATLPSLFSRLYDMDIATVHSNPRVKLSPRFGYPTLSTSLFAAAVAETMNVESHVKRAPSKKQDGDKVARIAAIRCVANFERRGFAGERVKR